MKTPVTSQNSKIVMIFASSPDHVIGLNNKLPWNIPDDLKRFRYFTEDNVVIMGRNTWLSLPKKVRPLPGRINIVVTSSSEREDFEGVDLRTPDLQSAIKYSLDVYPDKKIYLIGGKRIYEEGQHLCDQIYITKVRETVDGDVIFKPDLENFWPGFTQRYDDHIFTIFDRIKQ